MTKTKSQRARAKANKAKNAAQASGNAHPKSKGPRGPKPRKQNPSQHVKLGKGSKKGRAGMSARRTFSEILMSDGLNKALQMHNSSSIVDHFPRRMEKVCDVIPNATTFAVLQALFLNPGNSVLLPIFSKIAAVYEQYRWRFLKFHYVSEAYTASGSNISAGKVMMATNFDPDDAQFSSSTQMENYTGADRGAPFTNFCHDVLKSLKANRTNPLREYFVNASANQGTPGVSTDKFYDMGLFQFATAGLPSDSAVEYGELYVEFEVDMIRPKQADPASPSNVLLYAHFTEGPAESAAASTPLGTSGGILRAGSTLASVSASGTTFTLPSVGTYLVLAIWYGSAAAVSGWATYGSNITTSNLTRDNTVFGASAYAAGANLTSETFTVSAAGTSANNTVTLPTVTDLASGYCDLFIFQLPAVSPLMRKRNDLQLQVNELGRMMRTLLLKIPDNDDKIIMCEEKDDCEVVDRLRASGPASSGVRKGTSSITDPGYKAPPSSNNVTPLSGKQGLSKLFF